MVVVNPTLLKMQFSGLKEVKAKMDVAAEEKDQQTKQAEIEKALGYKGLAEVIHRDNLVVLSGPGGS